MSSNNIVEEARMLCCVSCGIAEVDDVKLKPCDGCDLVRYCSDACQIDHRPEHEVACKERAAELRDEILFRQPESSHQGDCPICCVPLPLEDGKGSLYPCCSKLICLGCTFAVFFQNRGANVLSSCPCPFCRLPQPRTDEDTEKYEMKRVAVNDPVALRQKGLRHARSEEYDAAFDYWTKAAEMGDAMAHYNLSIMYSEGQGFEKDEKKELYHLEEAAIRGHPDARHQLGVNEGKNGRLERSVKHFIIAANLGYDLSIKLLKELYKKEFISKEEFAAALRAHKAAVDATKSPQRESAEKFYAVHPRFARK